MNLDEILNKTKKRSERIKIFRKPPSIATTDRPYSIEEINGTQKGTIKETEKKQTTDWKQEKDALFSNESNRQQTGNKPSTKQTTNRQQIGNDSLTNKQVTIDSLLPTNATWRPDNGNQLSSEKNRQQIGNKSSTKKATSRQQSDNKALANKQVTNDCLLPINATWQNDNNKPFIEQSINRQQTDSKSGTKPTTNRQQSGNKMGTKWEPNNENIPEIKTPLQQTDNKPSTKLTTEIATNRQQTDSKPTTKLPFSSLVGLQKEIVIYLYLECKSSRSKITDSITLEYISDKVRCSKNTAKVTLQRLEKKGCIIRNEFKIGRGGWSKYEIPEYLYHDILRKETDNKLGTNWQQIDSKPATKSATEPTTNHSSSSSFKELKTTTTEEQTNTEIYAWLKEIDIEPLSGIGFSIHYLTQIASQNKLSPEIIQQSINAFAFDLTENDKAKKIAGNSLNYFMGILRKGMPYLPPPNYEDPQDRAMRLFLERKKETEKIRLEREEELLKLACGEWLESLSEEEKEDLTSEDAKKMGRLSYKLASLRTYFKENLWSKKRAEFLGSI